MLPCNLTPWKYIWFIYDIWSFSFLLSLSLCCKLKDILFQLIIEAIRVCFYPSKYLVTISLSWIWSVTHSPIRLVYSIYHRFWSLHGYINRVQKVSNSFILNGKIFFSGRKNIRLEENKLQPVAWGCSCSMQEYILYSQLLTEEHIHYCNCLPGCSLDEATRRPKTFFPPYTNFIDLSDQHLAVSFHGSATI